MIPTPGPALRTLAADVLTVPAGEEAGEPADHEAGEEADGGVEEEVDGLEVHDGQLDGDAAGEAADGAGGVGPAADKPQEEEAAEAAEQGVAISPLKRSNLLISNGFIIVLFSSGIRCRV